MHDALKTSDGLRALAARDITTIYRLLTGAGVQQSQIASMTGQNRSEVSEIVGGRCVMGYDVLVKIAEGLDIPRGLMGLSYGAGDEPSAYSGADSPDELDEEMKRRALLALASVTLFNRPVLGELLELPKRREIPTPLPRQLGTADVEALEALTAELRSWAQRWGGGASTVGAIAQRSERLLSVSAAEPARVALGSTLAKLHTVAGWAAFDEQIDETARFHFARAMSLAGDAADPYWIAFALYGGGRIVAESGHPNDALKYYQLSHVALTGDDGRHSRAPILTGYLHSESALEYAAMGHRDTTKELTRAQENPLDADSYNIAAETHLRLGNLDIAHQFATHAVREWEGSLNRRHAVISDITLATINVQAGEPRGKLLANNAIRSVEDTRSGLARVRLERLAKALDSRPDRDNRDLAALARKIAGQRSSK